MPVQHAAVTESIRELAGSVRRHPALENDFYRHWLSGPLPYRQVEVFAREFYARTIDTTAMIALSVLHTDDLAARVERVKHLYTEYGNGDPDKAHLLLLERMLTGLLGRLRDGRYTVQELRSGTARPETRAFGDARRALFTDPDARVVQGALLAQDALAHATTVRMYEGMRNYKHLYEEEEFHSACEYFYVHICEAAKTDRAELVAAAAAVCHDEVDLAQVRRGFDGVLDLTAAYWAAVHRAMRAV
ncbi:iron-containing redox enzyme family protein [Actinomadura atramentaria]|uniref:iron-containing redox enzyme family protein n=1 Tax=Actinomadura atramentaria TaxID=1990 RepID=UPI00037AD95C|nr:iron-containing redox enzyme family protein [Actinomadura atramentaria]